MDLNFQNTREIQKHAHTMFSTLLIDSRDRDRTRFPSPTRYTVDLPTTLFNVTEAKLVSSELPSSFYVFTTAAQNTTLDVSVNGLRKLVTIPDGNYGFSSITTAIKKALESAYANEGYVFTLTSNANTFKMQIEIDDPSLAFVLYTPDYVTDRTHWGLSYYLGFERNSTITATDGVLYGTRPASLNPISYVLLDIEEFGSIYETEIMGRGGSASMHTFAKVPINVDSFKYAFYDKPITHNTFYPPIPRLQRLQISWRFHSGEPIDFQGLDHSFTLQVTHTPIQMR